MTLRSHWDDSLAVVARNHSVQRLYLNHALGWPTGNLEFLHEIPKLRELHLLSPNLVDLTALSSLNQIKSLTLEVSRRARLDLESFSLLEQFSGFWHTVRDTVFRAPRLKRLRFIGYPGAVAQGFASLQQLQGLALYSPKCAELGDVFEVSQLRSLSIAHASSLSTLEGVARLNILRELSLVSCPRIHKINALTGLRMLESLILEDCRDIASLEPIRALTSISTLRVVGNTRVADGDLSALDDLRNLKSVAFVERRSYNRKKASFPKDLFAAKYRLAWD